LCGKSSYGQLRWGGRTLAAHRVSYALAYGPPDPALEVCHRCDTPCCVSPGHLFLGSHKANHADALAKNRYAASRGGGSRRVLTFALAEEIRAKRAAGASARGLAAAYGVEEGHVHRILSGRVWAKKEGV
jgi:hypothetical protein